MLVKTSFSMFFTSFTRFCCKNEENWAKRAYFCLIPKLGWTQKCWSSTLENWCKDLYFLQNLKNEHIYHVFASFVLLFVSDKVLTPVASLCPPVFGNQPKIMLFFSLIFASKSCKNIKKHGKGKFCPVFGVHSTQALVEIKSSFFGGDQFCLRQQV